MAVTIATALLSMAGCSDDNGPGGGGVIDNNNGHTDTGAADTSDTSDAGPLADAHDASDAVDISDSGADVALVDTGDSGVSTDVNGTDVDAGSTDTSQSGDCGGTQCAVGEVCIDDHCETETADHKCQAAENLGEIALGDSLTVTGTLRRASDVLTTACGPAQGGDEAVFTFTVAETVSIDFQATWQGQFDGVVAFRTDVCNGPGLASDPCYDIEQQSFRAEAGHTYYMIVELAAGRGNQFSIALAATDAGCAPGSVSCSSDVLTRCELNGQEKSYDCADACNANADACMGASCPAAIPVTASATFTGDLRAYDGRYNFEAITGCEVDNTPIQTPGKEVVFSLPGLTAGQTITIDAKTNDQNNNAIFITSNCTRPDELTCEAGDLINDQLTWTVPSNGDYFVFIDKATVGGTTFQYSIDIQ